MLIKRNATKSSFAKQTENCLGIDITLLHDLHYLDDFLHMLACSYEPLKHEHLVIIEHVSILATHDLQDNHSFKNGKKNKKNFVWYF